VTAVDVDALKRKARWVRRTVLDATAATGKGHLGGTYSCTDLLVALYYGGLLRTDPRDPRNPARDRLIVSKGHACLALYAIFLDRGFISIERFREYGRDGGSLGAQLDVSIPGVETNTGSLGHALGIGAGMALAAKMDGLDFRVFALLGDAECTEGSVWEAALFADEHRLDNLIAIVDRNRLSVTDVLDDTGVFGNFTEKLHAFGWECRAVDGHDFPEILAALADARAARRPTMIVANTVKGKGVSFMENGLRWHHSVPTEAEVALARRELERDA
jgi:transketolase